MDEKGAHGVVKGRKHAFVLAILWRSVWIG
jgi:hypothetical protein